MALLYDPLSPRSPDAKALDNLVTIVSECDVFQELTETSTPAEALTHIRTGADDDPWNADEFTVDEMAQRFCELSIVWPVEGAGETVISEASPEPYCLGTYLATLRRFARESELSQQGRADLLRGFHDAATALRHEIGQKAAFENGGDLRLEGRISIVGGPYYGAKDSVSAQGEYLWCQYAIEWGDNIED